MRQLATVVPGWDAKRSRMAVNWGGQAGAQPMLRINARNVGEVTVLDLNGTLVVGLGLETLRSRMEQLVAAQRLKIVLNLSGVAVLDSSGVGDLVGSFSLVKKAGGVLKVASPTKI